MKNSRIHAVLSEIYRLLSDYSAAELTRASEYGGITPHIGAALRSLAHEAERRPAGTSKRPLDAGHRRPDSIGGEPASREDLAQKSGIVALLRRSQRFHSSQSILQFAREAGLDLAARPKESRDRLASRVASAILLAPEPRRSQILARLTNGSGSQTQGWIEVIKGERP
jgi:hypothetical protein